jgi:REP element-mobilizing transposase RayT
LGFNLDQPSRTDTLRRRSIRLAGFDYTQNSGYFVTLCTAKKMALFGHAANGAVGLSPLGGIVEEEWRKTADRRSYLALDIHVVMPNHFHALFTILRDTDARGDVARDAGPTGHLTGPAAESVGAIVRAFKSAVSCRARLELSSRGPIWQRNYFEHIIHTARQFGNAHDYIVRNPENWEIDHYNSERRAREK